MYATVLLLGLTRDNPSRFQNMIVFEERIMLVIFKNIQIFIGSGIYFENHSNGFGYFQYYSIENYLKIIFQIHEIK